MSKPLVLIVMGSQSDLPMMEHSAKALDDFGVAYEITIASAHRSPEWTKKSIRGAEKKGVEVFIAGAGGAAHLAGTIAAYTIKPVIGVPIDSSPLKGLDSLLATAQMPSGVPVATVAIGKSGAKNAGILAVQILALGRKELSKRLQKYKQQLEKDVVAHGRKLQRTRS